MGFLALMFVTLFGVASVFAWHGYWPILPFAGLEMLALCAAVVVTMRSNRYREVLIEDNGDIVLQSGHGRPEREWRYPLRATELLCELPRKPSDQVRLRLKAWGQDKEFGKCLTADEKIRLARRLRPLWQSPGRPVECTDGELANGTFD